MPIIAQVLKGKLLKITAFAHSQTTNKLVNKLPTILPGLAGKMVKNCPLFQPIRLQDLEDSARWQA